MGKHIAFFVTPHGFGHATRESAVMTALHELEGSLQFEIFTTVPRWVFEDSLSFPFGYHPEVIDIGPVQTSALEEDVPATLERLDEFLPFDDGTVKRLARRVKELRCSLVVCDIAPLGIAVAREAGITSILVENFTWDWIYEGYAQLDGRMKAYAEYLRGVFESADRHIRTQPSNIEGHADLTTRPVSRTPRTTRGQVRARLGIPEDSPVVLITMGGIEGGYSFYQRLRGMSGVYFIIPGGSSSPSLTGNLALLPHHSEFYHPDLINACEAVVGKLGYSTVAEAYHAGVPFGYLTRPRFRESDMLNSFVKERMPSIEIPGEGFQEGGWLDFLPSLLALPKVRRTEENGACQAAEFIRDCLWSEA